MLPLLANKDVYIETTLEFNAGQFKVKY